MIDLFAFVALDSMPTRCRLSDFAAQGQVQDHPTVGFLILKKANDFRLRANFSSQLGPISRRVAQVFDRTEKSRHYRHRYSPIKSIDSVDYAVSLSGIKIASL